MIRAYIRSRGAGTRKIQFSHIESLLTDAWKRGVDTSTSISTSQSLAIVGSKAYVFVFNMATYVYDLLTGAWETKTASPVMRYGVKPAVLDGKIYLIGGMNNYSSPLNAVNVYDPVTDTWVTKANLPSAITNGFVAVAAGKIYHIGGQNSSSSPYHYTYEYDPATNVWTRKADFPTPRGYSASAVVDGKIYCIGGSTGSTVYTAVSSVHVYDPATNVWTAKVNYPHTIYGGIAAGIDGKIYHTGGASNGTNYNTTYEYDPATNVWTAKASYPDYARESILGGASGGSMFVFFETTVLEYVASGVLKTFSVLGRSEMLFDKKIRVNGAEYPANTKVDAPAGALVEFIATDASGEISESTEAITINL